jgi:hypothetical protein
MRPPGSLAWQASSTKPGQASDIDTGGQVAVTASGPGIGRSGVVKLWSRRYGCCGHGAAMLDGQPAKLQEAALVLGARAIVFPVQAVPLVILASDLSAR